MKVLRSFLSWLNLPVVSDQEFILAPLGGHQYKSRLSAFKDMVLKGYSVEEKQQMKAKLVEFEGWEESSLLPTNWLFKVVWEGSNKEGRWSENVSFLSCKAVSRPKRRASHGQPHGQRVRGE